MFRRQEDGGEIEKDFLIRQLKKLIQAIKSVLRLVDEARVEEAESVLQNAAQEVLRVDPRRLAALDPASCRIILRSGSRLRMYAMVLRTEAMLCKRRGDLAEGDKRLQRAARMELLSAQLGSPDEQEQGEIASLLSVLGGAHSAKKR